MVFNATFNNISVISWRLKKLHIKNTFISNLKRRYWRNYKIIRNEQKINTF